jgi:hypothetical protein
MSMTYVKLSRFSADPKYDPGKPVLRVAAVEIALDHLLADRPEEAE